MKAKQLTKLLTGWRYYRVTDRKASKRRSEMEPPKRKRKSLRLSMAVKSPDDVDNNDGVTAP